MATRDTPPTDAECAAVNAHLVGAMTALSKALEIAASANVRPFVMSEIAGALSATWDAIGGLEYRQ